MTSFMNSPLFSSLAFAYTFLLESNLKIERSNKNIGLEDRRLLFQWLYNVMFTFSVDLWLLIVFDGGVKMAWPITYRECEYKIKY